MFERFTSSARRAMVLTNKAARDRGHDFIGGAHLGLGLLQVDQQSGSGLFARLGIDDVENLRVALEKEADEAAKAQGVRDPAGSDPPFTPAVKKALEMSLREALKLSQNWIGLGHMLLGLINSAASSVMVETLPLDGARDAVTAWEGDQPVSEQAVGEDSERNETMAKGFSQVLKFAMTKGTKPVGSHHLLIGMFEAGDTLARKVLESLGVTEDKVRDAIESIGTAGTIDEPPQPEYEVRVGDHSLRVDDPRSREMLLGILKEDDIAERIQAAMDRRAKETGN